MLESLPDRVTIYEVAPRDGLQNERMVLATADKLRLIQALVDAGVPRLEVTSFVSPKWVPQLADAEALVASLPGLAERPRNPAAVDEASAAAPNAVTGAAESVRYSALCPNVRGLGRARQTDLQEIVVFVSADEEHNRRNLNQTIDDSLAQIGEVVREARAHGFTVRGSISTVWGFRSERALDLPRALAIGRVLADMGCNELALNDTMGHATPGRTRDVLRAFLAVYPADMLALHMHDTRGTALANVLVGLELGLRTFDAAVAGLGGCPFAPGAAGNLATEDVVYMLHGLGVETGIALDKLIAAGKVAAALVGRELPGKVHRAGLGTAP